jgi:hypothetical protein
MRGALHSSSSILRWIAYPVEAFGFALVLREVVALVLKGECDRAGQPPGLFNEVNDHPEDQFRYIHKAGFVRA